METIKIIISKETGMVYLDKTNLGRDLENLQRELEFVFEDDFVDGNARLEYKVSGHKYHIPTTKVGESYTVPVKNVMTKEGQVEMQLVVVQLEQDEEIPVFKSNVFYMVCNKSINAQEEAPDDYEYWLDIIQEKLAEMDNINLDAERVEGGVEVEISKKDGTTKTVMVYDGPQGPQGPQGPAGEGNVDDVKVNGTSVVDANKVANIDISDDLIIIHGSTQNTPETLAKISKAITSHYHKFLFVLHAPSSESYGDQIVLEYCYINQIPLLTFQTYMTKSSKKAFNSIWVTGTWENDVFTATRITANSSTPNDVAITLGNTASYTPTGDYNPATKKYVDDSIASAITDALGGNY